MSVDKVVIGESGEVVLPPKIRSALHLKAGSELLIERTGAGVLLKPATTGGGLRLEDLRGFLKAEGPAVPDLELCRPVDLSLTPGPSLSSSQAITAALIGDSHDKP